MTTLQIAVVVLMIGDLVLMLLAMTIQRRAEIYRNDVRISHSCTFAYYYARAVDDTSYEVVRDAYLGSEQEVIIKRFRDDDAEYNLLQAKELCDKLNEQ